MFIIGYKKQGWVFTIYGAALKTVDFVVEGLDRSKGAMIVTTNPDEICKVLTEEFESGMTRIDVKGGYSGEGKTMVYFILNRFQISRMKNLVHATDPGAFITIVEVADVYKANIDA